MRRGVTRIARFAVLLSAVAASSWWLIAADAPASPPPPAAIVVQPRFLRCDVDAGASRDIDVAVTAAVAATVLAAESDCRCVSLRDALPVAIAAGATVHFTLRAVGVAPGIKTIAWRTTAGTVVTHVQVVTSGLGTGAQALDAAIKIARSQGWALWFLVHDLRGEPRNCGCSAGALGGADLLAALPATLRDRAPGLACRFLLSGDGDGKRPEVATELGARGWRRDDQAIRVAADPQELLAAPGVVAVVSGDAAVQHRRIVRPILDRGAVVVALMVDAAGVLQNQLPIPVDRTLPADSDLLAALPAEPAAPIGPPADLSARCQACHASAYDAWAASRHARAWQSLAEVDRTDACIGCHSTSRAEAAVPQVHCQACHGDSEAHAESNGARRCAPTVDCRSCHDARQHPAFDRAALWQRIVHGR